MAATKGKFSEARFRSTMQNLVPLHAIIFIYKTAAWIQKRCNDSINGEREPLNCLTDRRQGTIQGPASGSTEKKGIVGSNDGKEWMQCFNGPKNDATEQRRPRLSTRRAMSAILPCKGLPVPVHACE